MLAAKPSHATWHTDRYHGGSLLVSERAVFYLISAKDLPEKFSKI
jgi:hypothetical protein